MKRARSHTKHATVEKATTDSRGQQPRTYLVVSKACVIADDVWVIQTTQDENFGHGSFPLVFLEMGDRNGLWNRQRSELHGARHRNLIDATCNGHARGQGAREAQGRGIRQGSNTNDKEGRALP